MPHNEKAIKIAVVQVVFDSGCYLLVISQKRWQKETFYLYCSVYIVYIRPMKTYLLYNHTRNIFIRNEWRSGITKWFDNPKFEGCESGNFGAVLSVTNYEEVKDRLPKTLKPIKSSNNLKEALCG